MRKPFVIGGKQTAAAVLVLAALSLIVVGIIALVSKDKPADYDTAQASATPAQPSPEGAEPSPVVPTAEVYLAPTPAEFWHIIQPDETLSGIGLYYGVPLQEMLTKNGMTIDSPIRDGQSIAIPLPPSQAGSWHVVEVNQTLTKIAELYNVPVDPIVAANNLPDANSIFVGQRLRIPLAQPADYVAPTLAITPTPNPETRAEGIIVGQWLPSIIEGDLAAAYPLAFEHERFTLHYQPNTYTNLYLAETVSLIEEVLTHIEDMLGVTITDAFDVYAAGTFFEAPNAGMRGYTLSRERQVFVLHDGSGTPAEQRYFFTRELTHMAAWNAWGTPAAHILSEGLATYVAQSYLDAERDLSAEERCTAILAAELLPSMMVIEQDWTAFSGEHQSPFNYFGAGCFTQYLAEQYGMETLRDLYTTADFRVLTGENLSALDANWQDELAEQVQDMRIDPADLKAYAQEVSDAYDLILNDYSGTETFQQAYTAIDQARSALWRGDFDSVRQQLDAAYETLGISE